MVYWTSGSPQLYLLIKGLLKKSIHVLCHQTTAQHGRYRSKMKLKIRSLEPNGSSRCSFADSLTGLSNEPGVWISVEVHA